MRPILLIALFLANSSFAQSSAEEPTTPEEVADPLSDDGLPVATDEPVDPDTLNAAPTQPNAAPEELDIRGIKPDLPVPNSPASMWPAALLGLAAAGAVAGAVFYLRREKKLTPEQQLRRALDQARARRDEGDVLGFADTTVVALRQFVADTTGISAQSMTGPELLTVLQPRLPDEVFSELSSLFQRFETLRFAGLVQVDDEALTLPWLDAFVQALTQQPETEAPSADEAVSVK